jgi:hypothetical protein
LLANVAWQTNSRFKKNLHLEGPIWLLFFVYYLDIASETVLFADICRCNRWRVSQDTICIIRKKKLSTWWIITCIILIQKKFKILFLCYKFWYVSVFSWSKVCFKYPINVMNIVIRNIRVHIYDFLYNLLFFKKKNYNHISFV